MSIKDIKQAIFKEWDKIPQQEYEIAGQKLVVRALSAYDLEQYRLWKNSKDEVQSCSANSKLVQLSLYDMAGSRIIDDNEVNQINGKFGAEIDKITDVILRLNGFNTVGADAILKNLRKILGDAGLRELRESIDALFAGSCECTLPTSL